MRYIALFMWFISFSITYANDSTRLHFETSFQTLKQMLEGKQSINFERAVYLSEYPYLNHQYTYKDFQETLDLHVFFIKQIAQANNQASSMDFGVRVNKYGRFNMNDIRYTEEQKKTLYSNLINNWAIFTYLTDTTSIGCLKHYPFAYEFEDPFGMKDWKTSQVMNLFTPKQKGNCYALASLFKILANRLNTNAKLCTAPQHIYIQHQNEKGHWYNVELATAGHLNDGKIQTLTYTTPEALKNNLALRTLEEKQTIGICLVNLAKSYEHKFNASADDFLLKCAELTLTHDPKNLNALLLKQQVLDKRVTDFAKAHKITTIYGLKQHTEIAREVQAL